MAKSIISRYGLSVEIPGEVEKEGADAVEAHVAAALDTQCRQIFRVPLAQLDAEVMAAIKQVPVQSEEDAAQDPDPLGTANARELAVKAAVDGALARATTRATTLPAPAPAPAAADDDEDEASR